MRGDVHAARRCDGGAGRVADDPAEHDAGFTDLEWVIDAYALSLASVILTCGALADRYGRRRVFIVGLVVFTVASLLCGVAQTTGVLILARALQGLGGGAMFATGLALIGQTYHGHERGRAIAAWGATVGAAVAVGPLIGGLLTDTLGWRWIFFVNVPIGIATVAVAAVKMVNVSDPNAKRLDIAGLVTFAGALFLFILALLRGNDDGWGSPPILPCLPARRCWQQRSWWPSSDRSGRCSICRCFEIAGSSGCRWPPLRSARGCLPCTRTSRSTCRTICATRRWPVACDCSPRRCCYSSCRS